jgi:hypothetical protein
MAIIALAESFGDLEERRALAFIDGLLSRLMLSRVVDAVPLPMALNFMFASN